MKFAVHYIVDLVAYLRFVRGTLFWGHYSFAEYRSFAQWLRSTGQQPYRPGTWSARLGGNWL